MNPHQTSDVVSQAAAASFADRNGALQKVAGSRELSQEQAMAVDPECTDQTS